jgi:fucose permease
MRSGMGLTLAAWLGIFIYGYLNAMLGIVLPNLMEKLRLDKAQAGKFFMFSSIGLIVSSVPSGPIMDSFGTKLVVCFGLFLVTASFWALGSISVSKLVYPLAFVLGLGGSMIVAGENTLVALINPSQREIAANLLNLFFGAGAFIAPFVVMPVLKRRGFSGVLRVSSIIAAFVLVFHILMGFPKAPQAQGFPLARATDLLAQPRLLLLMLLVLLYVGTEFSIWSWTVTFFTTARGYSQKGASRLISVFALAMIAGRYGDKWVLRAIGPERTVLASVIGTIICLAAMFRLRGWIGIHLATLVAGLSMAAIFPTAVGLAGHYFPALLGTAISLVITGGWIGAIIIPPAVGFVAERRGVTRAILIPVAAAVLMLIAPIALLSLR